MHIESLLCDWDGETVMIRFDRPTGAWIFIAIHSTRLGQAMGGTRMKSYPDPAAALLDALRLAASGMTYKFAVPNIPSGGGKAVIDVPAHFDPGSRPALLQRYGTLVRQLNGLFFTGPDVSISPTDMDIISLTAAPFILYAPDYVINVGGAMAVPGIEISGWSRQKAETEMADPVRRVSREVLGQAAAEGITTELAARRIAEDHLSRAV